MPRFATVRTLVAALVASLLLLLSGCGSDTPDEAPVVSDSNDRVDDADGSEVAPEQDETTPEPDEETQPSETTDVSIVATAVVEEVAVYAEPSDIGEPIHVLAHPTEVGAPRVFLVDGRPGNGWLEVLLPVRPNGSTGWIREADVTLARNPYRVDVLLSDFRVLVHRDDEIVVDTPMGYGADQTPTPDGRYYITELLQPPDPGGVYGPFAFGLSGFSEVHLSFAGGDGVIGIHGTNDPTSIGIQKSNGCIRIDNAAITEMASFLPLGTPVAISR